jgi:hypothetical protein
MVGRTLRRVDASTGDLARWSETGRDASAAWGRYQGTRPEPYRVVVAPPARVASCTCPSRRSPCKHALALLALLDADPAAVPAGERPSWAGERARAEAPASARRTRTERAATTEARAARIAGGLEEADRWLHDLVRQGLAAARAHPWSWWDGMAARLVDAQAPGAAGAVRRMGGLVWSGGDWPARVLEQAGRLHLLARAWPRQDDLPAATRADLRTVVGWAWRSESVLAGPTVRDRWCVLARTVVEEEPLRVRRTWLWGTERGQPALVLEFVPPGAALPPPLPTGTALHAELAFHPGSVPLRALVASVHGEAAPLGAFPGWSTLDEALAAHAAAVAANPWLERWPLVLTAAVPERHEDAWLLRDTEGAVVPLAAEEAAAWKLLAVSGGHPVGVAGEWAGTALRPLSAWAGDPPRLVRL